MDFNSIQFQVQTIVHINLIALVLAAPKPQDVMNEWWISNLN